MKLRNTVRAIWKRENRPCAYCNQTIDWTTRNAVVDHIKNRRQYPELAYELSNLVVMHRACNTKKYYNEERNDDRPQVGYDGLTDAWR